MPDLGLSNARTRATGRSRRSSGGDIDTGRVSVRSVDTPRTVEVARPGPNPFGALESAFSGFFAAAQQKNARDMAVEERQRNNREIARIETEVRKNPEAALEAVRSGDFSGFIPDDELRRREVIQSAFLKTTARVMAHRDQEELVTRIQQTPSEDDPDNAVEEFLRVQLEGADPIFGAEYSSTIASLSREPVAQFKAGRLEQQQVQALTLGKEALRDAVVSGEVPLTQEGIATLHSDLLGALPMNGPDAVAQADAAMANTLFRMAAEGNTAASVLIDMPMPNRDGLRLRDLFPDQAEEAIQAEIQTRNRVRSMSAHNDLNTLENRLSLITSGDATDDSLGRLWSDVWTHRNQFGESARWRSFRDRIDQAVANEGIGVGNVQRVLNNRTPNMSPTEWNDTALAWFNGGFEDIAVTRFGVAPEVARSFVTKAISNLGSGTKLKAQSSRVLLGSTNAEEVGERYARLRELEAASGRPMSIHLDDEAAGLFDYMQFAEETGRDPLQARQAYLDNREGAGDPEDHFARRLLSPGSGSGGRDRGATQGRAGVSEQARRLWNDLEADSLNIQGIQFFGGSKPNYDELPLAVQEEVERRVNFASFALHAQPASIEQIRALASRSLERNLGLSLNAEGDAFITLDQTPLLEIDSDGRPMAGRPVTQERLDDARTHLETDPNAQILMTHIGGFGGLAQDALTRVGLGLALMTNAGGFPEDIAMVPGMQFQLPATEIPEDHAGIFRFLEEAGRTDTGVTLRVPMPGETSGIVRMSDNLVMVYNDATGHWMARYIDGPPSQAEGQTIQDLATEEATRNPGRALFRGNPLIPGGRQNLHDTPEEQRGILDLRQDTLESMQQFGVLTSAAPVTTPTNDVGLIQATEQSILTTRSRGEWMNDITRPQSERHLEVFTDFLEEHEGFERFAYDDRTRRRIRPGARVQGNPTVGIGFNLNRPDAREHLSRVGLDFDKVRRGEQAITRDQAEKMVGNVLQSDANWLRRHFDGVEMPNHRWIALLSLVYNSRWTNDVSAPGGSRPTLISNTLTRAVRSGDWGEAARIIQERLLGGVPPSLLNGIRNRRLREANMFRGAFEADNS